MGYQKRGNDCLFWGRVTRDAYYKDGGAWKLAAFSIRYGYEQGEGDNGEREAKFLDVKCWGEIAEYGRLMEKGDVVLVAGPLKKDKKPDKDGNDRWYLDAEFLIVQPVPQAMEELPSGTTEGGDGPVNAYGGNDDDGDLPF